MLVSWSSALGHAQQRLGQTPPALAAPDHSHHHSAVRPSHPTPHPTLPETVSRADRSISFAELLFLWYRANALPKTCQEKAEKGNLGVPASTSPLKCPSHCREGSAGVTCNLESGRATLHKGKLQGHLCPALVGSRASEGGVLLWHGIIVSSAWAEWERE